MSTYWRWPNPYVHNLWLIRLFYSDSTTRDRLLHIRWGYTRRVTPFRSGRHFFSAIHSFAYSSLQLWQCGRTTTVNIPPACLSSSLISWLSAVTAGILLQSSRLFPTSRHLPSSGIDPHWSPNVVVVQETLWQVKIYRKRKRKRRKLSHHLWPRQHQLSFWTSVKYRGFCGEKCEEETRAERFFFLLFFVTWTLKEERKRKEMFQLLTTWMATRN